MDMSENVPDDKNTLKEPVVRLRLYVAKSTPNSVRAENNLSVVLDTLGGIRERVSLEIIDVFAQPKRAITDWVVVTPTLVGQADGKRVVLMGDLTDHAHLASVIEGLFDTESPRL